MELLNEVFDEENSKIYPVENVKPKLKVPQVFLIKVPGNNNLMIRLVQGSGQGDAVKNIKMGDKFIQVYVFSVSEKGNIGALKGGLGQDPIGAINTIFETVNKVVKQIKADAVMFRFNPKKMQGQDKAIQMLRDNPELADEIEGIIRGKVIIEEATLTKVVIGDASFEKVINE